MRLLAAALLLRPGWRVAGWSRHSTRTTRSTRLAEKKPEVGRSLYLDVGCRRLTARGASLESTLELAAEVENKLILAPLTRGGTPPFRSLCGSFGAEVVMGEMMFARNLVKGDVVERARLRRGSENELFGAQIATNAIEEGVAAARLAREAGASWVDLNCGCPIHEATRRGLGSALLRKPAKLARLVQGLIEGSPLPVSVKIRLGPGGVDSVNYDQLLELFAALPTPPAFVSLHGRTASARYTKPADWASIQAATSIFPRVVGNGDCQTPYEIADRKKIAPDAHAVMVGRGALVAPWIFADVKTDAVWLPEARERIEVYYKLAHLFKAHFGDDDRGKKSAWYFFPWHFNFFHRWRPLPEAAFADLAAAKPLIQSGRDVDDILRGDLEKDGVPPLEQLLRLSSTNAHQAIAHALWDAPSLDAALDHLRRLASPHTLDAWALEQNPSDHDRDEDEGHSSKPARQTNRRTRRNNNKTPL